jgi:hypothetical protein
MFWADELLRQVAASLVAGFASIIFGLFITWINRRRKKEKAISETEIDAIAHAAKAEDATKQSAILEALQKLAAPSASKEVIEALDRIQAALPLAD